MSRAFIWATAMVKLPDDAIFEQFTRPGKEDFAGLQIKIAERLRVGVDPAGAKWLADLFDPPKGFAFQAAILRRQGYSVADELKKSIDWNDFEDAYSSVGHDLDEARKKVQSPLWEGGLGWDRNKAYKFAKVFREYLEATRD